MIGAVHSQLSLFQFQVVILPDVKKIKGGKNFCQALYFINIFAVTVTS